MDFNKNLLAEKLLKDLVLDYHLSITSIEEGVKKLAKRQKDLEVVHIYIENLHPSCYGKKEYFHISKVDKLTKLDEWLYKNLINEEEYRKYLENYLPLKNKLKYDDVDEYILQKHYRPKAIKILSKKRKRFNLKLWRRKRYGYHYQRKTNLSLKDGHSFRFDFRNFLESIFILKEGGNRQILAVGGGGGSGQRAKYTIFTAVFYILSKEKKINHHLLRYNSFNRFEYINTFTKPIITFNLGSNYSLNEKLEKEIRKNGVNLKEALIPRNASHR